jgi:hypothetical protein
VQSKVANIWKFSPPADSKRGGVVLAGFPNLSELQIGGIYHTDRGELAFLKRCKETCGRLFIKRLKDKFQRETICRFGMPIAPSSCSGAGQ